MRESLCHLMVIPKGPVLSSASFGKLRWRPHLAVALGAATVTALSLHMSGLWGVASTPFNMLKLLGLLSLISLTNSATTQLFEYRSSPQAVGKGRHFHAQGGSRPSTCGFFDTRILDIADTRREALAAINDDNQSEDSRRRAVHSLTHGSAGDDVSLWKLRNAVQDRHLSQEHRYALLVAFCKCDAASAVEALDLFSRDSSNNSFARLDAAQRILDQDLKRRSILAIATAADVHDRCRFEAAMALKPIASREAEAALQFITGDRVGVDYDIRISAAYEWAALNREPAVEALWHLALSTGTPWHWRVMAAAKLALLRVRAAYDLLHGWLDNLDVPMEAREHVLMTLRWLGPVQAT